MPGPGASCFLFSFRGVRFALLCFSFFATPIFGQRDAYFSHCLFSRDPWANVSNRAVLLVFVLVHAFLICCFFLANRGVLLALVCSLPSLQGGFAFLGFALVAPRGLLFVIPERTFRIAVFWCFSKMLFFGPGATKCRIGNVKKPTMQDARAGAPNKKGYARAGAQGKPDAPGQRKKSNAKRTRRDAN